MNLKWVQRLDVNIEDGRTYEHALEYCSLFSYYEQIFWNMEKKYFTFEYSNNSRKNNVK